MTTPRLEIDLDKIRQNARSLVDRLEPRGIAVTGVTKAVCGHPGVAQAMLEGGVAGIAEARISNVERLRNGGITGPITMIRSPMPSQIAAVVRLCATSYNTEIDVVAQLSKAAVAARVLHKVILMVDLGDLREGILPDDLIAVALQVVAMPGVTLVGIGANFACLGSVTPDAGALTVLSNLAFGTQSACGKVLKTVSGGNSSSLSWALGAAPSRRVNDLRLGEAILLGVDPVSGAPIAGLHRDAFTLTAEVIETKVKPASGARGSGGLPCAAPGIRLRPRSLLALGVLDTDVRGLGMPANVTYVGATSDHLVVEAAHLQLPVGTEVSFEVTYAALARAMTSPNVRKTVHAPHPDSRRPASPRRPEMTAPVAMMP